MVWISHVGAVSQFDEGLSATCCDLCVGSSHCFSGLHNAKSLVPIRSIKDSQGYVRQNAYRQQQQIGNQAHSLSSLTSWFCAPIRLALKQALKTKKPRQAGLVNLSSRHILPLLTLPTRGRTLPTPSYLDYSLGKKTNICQSMTPLPPQPVH